MLDVLIMTGIFWIPVLFMKITKMLFGISDAELQNEKEQNFESNLKEKDPQIRYSAKTILSREQIAGGLGFFVWLGLILWVSVA